MKKNLNTIIGIGAILVILVVWVLISRPSKEEVAKQRQIDSIAAIDAQEANDSIDSVNAIYEEEQVQVQETVVSVPLVGDSVVLSACGGDTSIFDSVKTELIKQIQYDDIAGNSSPFINASIPQNNDCFVVQTDKLRATISNKGGQIVKMELMGLYTWDSASLVTLFDTNTSVLSYRFMSENGNIFETKNLYFEPICDIQAEDNKYIVSGTDSLEFAMRLKTDSGDSYIEFAYCFKADDYMLSYDINFANIDNSIINYEGLIMDWHADLHQQEKNKKNEKLLTSLCFYDGEDYTDMVGRRGKDKSVDVDYALNWVSFKQQFFASVLISDDKQFVRAKFSTESKFENDEASDTNGYLRSMHASVNMPYDNIATDQNIAMNWYFGPTHYNTLKEYDENLESMVPLGKFFLLKWINRYVVIPVFNWLGHFGWNYGIIILVLTLLLKLILFPIAYKTYKSSAKMRVLKPEVDEISKKFPKKEDAAKKQQATMALYKKVGANPMSGCLPMLLQMPILIALFRFFPAAFELRQESFLWATDLSSYDSIFSWTAQIPLLSNVYGNHISLFTLLMTISTFLYTYINNKLMATTNQQPGMKLMMYMMPIMFLGFFNKYAAALSYYYFLANMITFMQMFLIRKFTDEDKIRAQLLAKKVKPKKKSNWQKRLEDAQRAQKRK